MPYYSKSIIYCIYSTLQNANENDVYYGSTVNIKSRWSGHKTAYKDYLNNNGKKNSTSINIFDKYGIENCTYKIIEKYPCNTKTELLEKEKYYITNNECVNKQTPNKTNEEKIQARQQYREENKDIINKRYNKMYENNKDKIKEQKKEYRKNNDDKVKESNKKYYENNKENVLEICKQYRDNNQEKIKEYYEKNREKILERKKKYNKEHKEERKKQREINKDKIKEQKKEYIKNNEEKVKESRRRYYEKNKEKNQGEK